MKTCNFCQAPYEFFTERETWIPTCDCLQQHAEALRRSERDAEHVAAIEQRLAALQLGIFGQHDRQAPLVEEWKNPVENIRRGENLIITGGVGRRKTTALKQIAYHAAMAGMRVRGGNVFKMTVAFKEFDDLKRYRSWLLSGDILFLDDMDKLLGTAYEAANMLSLVDHFWSNGLSIVATLNGTVDELQRKIGSNPGKNLEVEAEAIISRLMSRATLKEFTGPDLRLACGQ